MASEPSTNSVFPQTDWTQLGKAAAAEPVSLDRLIRLYWQPLKIFLIATFPNLSSQADTLLQDFAADKMLQEGWLKKADQARGRFRDFLKTSLRNFVLNRLNLAENKNPPVPLQDLEEELPQAQAASEEFDLAWARIMLDETLRLMEADCKDPAVDQPRRTQIWELFRVRIIGPILHDTEVPYEELIERFGLKSPSEAFNTLLSGKRIFKA